MTIHEFVKAWYGRVPRYGTPEFVQYICNNIPLARHVANRNDIKLVIDPQTTTAFCFMETTSIYIPAKCLTREYYENFLGYPEQADESIMITAITGFTIHEAHHILYTPEDINTLSKLVTNNSRYFNYENEAKNIANLVEDLYIDSEAQTTPYGNFVRLLSDIFYHDENFRQCIAKWEKDPTWVTGINLICGYKRIANRDNAVWNRYPDLKMALDSVCRLGLSVSDRQSAVFNTFTALYNLIPKDRRNSVKTEIPALGELTHRPDGSPVTKADSRLLADGLLKDDIQQTIEAVQQELHIIQNELQDERIPSLRIYNVVDNPIKRVDEHPNFRGFARLLQNVRTERHVPRISDTGSKVLKTQLHRWIDDKKVLDGSTRRNVQSPPEVVILIDASGSMGVTLYQEVLSAAKSAFVSCRQAGISVAVLAHTTHHRNAVVYKIASHNMVGPNTTNIEAKFGGAKYIQQQCNVDGVAIEYASKQFTHKTGEKYLLVLSDGQPSGSGSYYGDFAVNHTINAVRECRQKGIKVLSISLVDEVVPTNNKIYGVENNVIATTREKLESGLKHVLLRL